MKENIKATEPGGFIQKKSFGELLVEKGVISQEQLRQAREVQKTAPGDLANIILDLGFAGEREIASARAASLSLSHAAASGQQPQDSEELLTIDEAGKFLDTSKSTIYRLLGQGDLKGTKVGKQWRFRKSDLTAYLERGPEAISMDASARAELDALAGAIGDLSVEGLERGSEDAKVMRIAHYVVQQAIRAGASDVHVEPMQNGVRIRHRVDGVLGEVMTIPKTLQAVLTARFKIMADLNIMEKRVPQSGRIPIKTDGSDYHLRLSTMPTYFGESIVMRILDKTSVLLGLDKLGLSEGERHSIEKWIHKPSGIIITTGPTESGKTTMMYSMLGQLDTETNKIMTIEDPVEFILPGVCQTQVNKRADLTFTAGLRSFMQHDPDVIMVGEQRDVESALTTVEAAVTGRLVLTVLHTEGAPAALIRLVEMGIERYSVASTVIGVVGTRLCRRLCPSCKTLVAGDSDLLSFIYKMADLIASGGYAMPDRLIIYEAVGCEECRGTGYRGRIALHEVLDCEPRFTARLLQCASTDEMTKLAVENGMRTLLADGMSKVVAGETTVDEVLRATGTWL